MKHFFLLFFCLSTQLHAFTGIPKANYQIKASIPLPEDCFTQGFAFFEKHFYLSCGRYGESRLIKLDRTGKIIKELRVDKDIFLEGITFFQNKLYALTWKANQLFIINPKSLVIEEKKSLKGENWGLTSTHQNLLKNNGSSHIDILDAQLRNQGSISLQNIKKRPILDLNAMTTVGDLLLINVWRTNALLFVPFIPDKALLPSLWVDLSPLNNTWSFRWTGITANGVTYDPETQCLWVTGKKWGKAHALSLQLPKQLARLAGTEFNCQIHP